MRHFIARVQGCGVIAECDTEFGKVLSPENAANESVMPSVRVEPEKLSHLDEGQRAELVEVLDEFAACFSDKPGLCDVVTHRNVTTPEFVPKQMRPYRVPIAFRAEVNRQIREPSDMELIRRMSVRWRTSLSVSPRIRDCASMNTKPVTNANFPYSKTLALQEFDLEIKYKREWDNVVADYLSRHA